MAEGLSTTTVSGLLNALRSTGAAYGPPAGNYIQLHTANPGAAGTTAISVGSTTRLAATLNASSGGSALALSSSVGPWTNGGTTETITDISVWTASSAGTFLWSVALTVSQPWISGNSFTLNSLSVALTPQAA
jgi:hypothetical protein